MRHALRNTAENRPAPAIPTKREIELFLLTPRHEPMEIIEEWDDEDDGLTNVKYYSPTSD